MHFINLHNLKHRFGANLFCRLAERLNPVVNGDMTTFQQSANRAKSQSLKVELERLSLYCRTFTSMLNGMSKIAKFTTITLPFFYDTIFHAFFRTAFWTSIHKASSSMVD